MFVPISSPPAILLIYIHSFALIHTHLHLFTYLFLFALVRSHSHLLKLFTIVHSAGTSTCSLATFTMSDPSMLPP
ncbi:uncharacterized protein EDB91DRAFT_58568 [Suillus paluster]|uniref:uncharacterized protein n=1 Tax=Suillus paluster TaxID=48578 RepID=UPI001B86E6AF|nr:uncharacterized protein EDB91DRAFT_58568 [Suillus paluster]KAG1726638.1 hypothetical protein EDB91DRAFT_58568 [Suillus paluster]